MQKQHPKECNISWNESDKCTSFLDFTNVHWDTVQYSDGSTKLIAHRTDPMTGKVEISESVDDFPGDQKVVKFRRHDGGISCVDLDYLYAYMQHNPQTERDLRDLDPDALHNPCPEFKCHIGADDVGRISSRRKQEYPQEPEILVAERKRQVEDFIPTEFVAIMDAITLNWYQNLEQFYSGINSPKTYSLLNRIGLESFEQRPTDFLGWLQYSIAHEQGQYVDWWNRLLRAVIICNWFQSVQQGELSALQKLELYWTTYWVGSTYSDFSSIQHVLDYWMKLPFTVMDPEWRQINWEQDINVSNLASGPNFLQGEVLVWASQVGALGELWQEWVSRCGGANNNNNQWTDGSQHTWTCDPTSYKQWLSARYKIQGPYASSNTPLEQKYMEDYLRRFFATGGSDTTDTAMTRLRNVYEQQRPLLRSFSQFSGSADSWFSHLSRLSLYSRDAELRWLAWGYTASLPRRVTTQMYNRAQQALCGNQSSYNIQQFFSSQVQVQNKSVLLFPNQSAICVDVWQFEEAQGGSHPPAHLACRRFDRADRLLEPSDIDKSAMFIEVTGFQQYSDLPARVLVSNLDYERFVRADSYVHSHPNDPEYRIFEIRALPLSIYVTREGINQNLKNLPLGLVSSSTPRPIFALFPWQPPS